MVAQKSKFNVTCFYTILCNVLHNNLYLYITHGNILSMKNKHKKLFVIQVVKKALIYTYNAPKCVWRPGSARTRWGANALPQAP